MERSNPAGLIGDNLFERLLLSLGRYSRRIGTQRSDDKEYEGGESLRTTFGLASPLLRPYITDSSRIQHRFTTFASGILDENLMKRCSKGDETPKLVWSRHESGQEEIGLSSFVPTDYLPYNYDVSRRVQENRKTATKTRIEKRVAESEGDADKPRKATDLVSTVYQLSSAQDLPWFYFCSTSLRSASDCAPTRLRSLIGAASQIHRSKVVLG